MPLQCPAVIFPPKQRVKKIDMEVGPGLRKASEPDDDLTQRLHSFVHDRRGIDNLFAQLAAALPKYKVESVPLPQEFKARPGPIYAMLESHMGKEPFPGSGIIRYQLGFDFPE
jgi:hypothetical protein